MTELVVQQFKDNVELRARFLEHGIAEIDIRGVLSEILGVTQGAQQPLKLSAAGLH